MHSVSLVLIKEGVLTMRLDEITISRAIVESFKDKFVDCMKSDVAIAGGGPTGLIASYYLAKAKVKVVLFERKLSIGGGIWGGGMMFNEIVVQEDGKRILDELGIKTKKYKAGYYLADSIEVASTLTSRAVRAGAHIFNLISVEDVMIKDDVVQGLVLNWTAVEMAKLHVDPLTVEAKFIVDATGHPAEIAQTIERKVGCKLNTETGRIIGERPMWADVGERVILENTREFFPHAYVAGMAANNVFGGPRMGPIFGGMFLSGEKVAKILMGRLRKPR